MKGRTLLIDLCCAVICTFIAAAAFAQTDPQFAKATQAYAQGHFKEAIGGYEMLVRSGQWSANLFYDLGNAYFRTGDFGRAILNYERALALERHHPEAAADLQIARDEARALEMQQTWLESYLQFASVNQYIIAATGAFWVAALCIVDPVVFGLRIGNSCYVRNRPRQQRSRASDHHRRQCASPTCDSRYCQ